MEEEKKGTVEGNGTEETGKAGTQASQNKDEGAEKTYTQEEYNAFEKKLKEKYEKKYAGIDIAKYKEWVESQKTQEEKTAEKELEYQKAISEKEEILKENKVLKAGVKSDDVEFITFKVSKMEGDFEENLTKFLKENPKYLNVEPQFVKKVSSSVSMAGKTNSNLSETNQKMNDLIRSARD